MGGGGGGGAPFPYLPGSPYVDDLGDTEERPQYLSARAMAAAIAVAIEGGSTPRRVAASIALSAEDDESDEEP